MEPMNATASVSADGKSAELWVSTQTQSLSILGAARFLDTTPDKITLHPMYIGGGFGARTLLKQPYAEDALWISRIIKKPVKVIWTRENDVKNGVFRPAASQYVRAALDAEGRLIGWHQRVAVPVVVEYMNPDRWERSKPQDRIAVSGADNSRYDIPNSRAEHLMLDRHSRVCAWRGTAKSYTHFAFESFLDEVAHVQGVDPLQYRLDHCHNHPRTQKVLETVATMADWSRPRSETALGIGMTNIRKAIAAVIAEVSVDEKSGKITVHNLWIASDSGFAVSPRNLEAQIEGNVVWGLSSSLTERITINQGQVKQSNFYDYHVPKRSTMRW